MLLLSSAAVTLSMRGPSDERRRSTAAVRQLKSTTAALTWLAEHDTAKHFEVAMEDSSGVMALETVRGFFEPGLLPALHCLDTHQKKIGTLGSVGEIGVYHGRSFVPLALLRRESEVAVAVDCFDEQQYNQDESGVGSEAAFNETLRRFGCTQDVRVLSCDSTSLTPDELLAAACAPFRLLSVDGSHTEEAVIADLALASAVLADGGVVILDDAVNPDWPGNRCGI